MDILSDGSTRYLHGAGLDEPLEMQPAGSTPAQSYLQDHLGSTTRLLHAATGQDTARYDYTSYGDLEGNASNPSLMNPYTYTGREDDGTGLMYYRARYYDPELEVFISQDPLGDKQRYVSGNPLKYLDPSGLVDVLFNNTMLGHMAILTEPIISGNDSSRYVYGNGLGQGPTTAQGTLGNRMPPLPGFNDYIVELDPNIFGNDNEFFNDDAIKTPPYTLAPLPINPGGNCSGYVASFLNQVLRKKGLPELNLSLTPGLLLLELKSRGYIKQIYPYRY